MSIDFTANPSLDDILAEYATDIQGLTSVLGFVDQAVTEFGKQVLEDQRFADDMVEGFRQGLALFADLPPGLRKGAAGAVLEGTRLLVELADAAKADGRIVTLRSLGLALGSVSLRIVQRDADAGNVEAQEAIAFAKERGLIPGGSESDGEA